ncbi:hypothetical protein [Streptomyces sp. SBT349]|uniref:hypothetical protein n=1 Tax=Streptomyces sp. SBT349 TaxID=1580539 RepID=UPI00066C1F98|nr:hypothetical protein [Streptomyces sp. SBT349]
MYSIRYVDVAKRQRAGLPPEARTALERILKEMRADPYKAARKGRDGVWWRDFGPGSQIMYLISDHIITVTVLRITVV